MLNFITQVCLTIILVVVFKVGALGVLLATFITSILFFFYVIFAFLRHQSLGIDKIVAKEAYRYSLPLLPHTLANWSNSTIDKLLLNGIRSESDAGLYNLGSQYSSVATTMSIAVNNAYVPWFFDKANDIENNLPQIRKMSEMITWSVCFICMVMSLLSQEVLDLMISNPAYDGVWKVIPFLICGTIFGTIYFFYVNVLFLRDTGYIFTITISTIVVNIALNILFIPRFGFIGCGLAFMATFFLKSVLAVVIAMWKNHEIRFRTAYLYMIGFVTSAISISALLFERCGLLVSIGIKALIIASFACYLLITYKAEFNQVIQGIKRKK